MEDITEYLRKKKPEIDRAIEKVSPRAIDKAYAEHAFGKSRYDYDTESLTKSLSEPIWDLLDRGGKRWRPALFLLITELLGSDTERLREFSAIPELIHNGTLMVDDIEDLSELRRGKPCTHKTFGQDVAINTGNYMYFIPMLPLMKSNTIEDSLKVRAYQAYLEEMINVSVGQALDIWWHKGSKLDVTEEQYLQMCAYKTGTLSRLSARLAAIFSGADKETETLLGRLAESLGVGFQLQDDILSATPEQGNFAKKKGYGDDITEGKRTLIVIHALKHSSRGEAAELTDILNKHTRDPKLIARALEILNKHGSVDYARDLSRRIIQEAWDHASSKLPGNPAKKTLESFMQFVITRKI